MARRRVAVLASIVIAVVALLLVGTPAAGAAVAPAATATAATLPVTGRAIPILGAGVAIGVAVVMVIGAMYFGVVTPTEAAGFGCALALLIGLIYRDLTLSALGEALRDAFAAHQHGSRAFLELRHQSHSPDTRTESM